MRYHRWKNKDEWVASRKIGDVVCDGHGRHQMIIGINYFDDIPRWVVNVGIWLHNFVEKRWGPIAADKIEDRWLDLVWKLGIRYTRQDIDFDLVDGWSFNGYDSCNEPQPDGSCHLYLEQ